MCGTNQSCIYKGLGKICNFVKVKKEIINSKKEKKKRKFVQNHTFYKIQNKIIFSAESTARNAVQMSI